MMISLRRTSLLLVILAILLVLAVVGLSLIAAHPIHIAQQIMQMPI